MSIKDFIRKSVLNSAGKARKTLESKGIHYDEDSFIQCVQQGKLDEVNLFLEAGMTANAKGRDGILALPAAVSANQAAVIAVLAAAGADSNIKDGDGNSLLMQAILSHQEAAGVALIAAGAQVDSRNNAGFSAAMLCARENQPAITEALLKAGADVLPKNHATGETAMITAARLGHTRMVELMLRNVITSEDREATDKTGATAIWWASNNGFIDAVRLLCARKADVNLANSEGVTPLQAAERHGHVEIAQELRNAGARS